VNLLFPKAGLVEKPLFGAFLYLLFVGSAPIAPASAMNAVTFEWALCPFLFFGLLLFGGAGLNPD
jgi:hypothetical protein